MAPPVYSLRIYVAGTQTGSHSVVVPAGFIYVLRDVDVVWRSGPFPASFGVIGSNLQYVMFTETDNAGNPNYFAWRGRQVWYPGESITFIVTTGVADVTASGYQLTLP